MPLSVYDLHNKELVVYKMSLDDFFYIGSTINLADRIRKHIRKFINGNNYKILMNKYSDCSVVKFEILNTAPNNTELRDLERIFIAKEINNPLLLNKALGTKIIVGFTRQKKIVKKIYPDGREIIFKSIAAAAMDINYERNNFFRDVKRGWKLKGFLYKVIDEMGDEVPVLKPIKPDKIFKYTKEGVKICGYRTAIEASKNNNVSRKCIYDTLHGIQKTTGGFVFKYA